MGRTFKAALSLMATLSLLTLGQASAQAAASKWKGLLNNQMLSRTVSVGNSGISVPGVNVHSGTVKTTTELHLCADGSFLRVEKVNVGAQAVNAGGVSVASPPINDIKKASGKWKIVSADAVHVNIQLTPAKAVDLIETDRKLDISFDGANTMVNGERWARMKSPICR